MPAHRWLDHPPVEPRHSRIDANRSPVGPVYTGDIPDGFTDVLHFDTDLVVIVGRTRLLGVDDVENLRPITAAFQLEPRSARLGTGTPVGTEFDRPLWDHKASRDERFIGHVNQLPDPVSTTPPERDGGFRAVRDSRDRPRVPVRP